MSNEEMNKKMEFIVEQQARFAVEIEMMREAQAEDAKQLRNLSDAVITVVGVIGTLTQAHTHLTQAQTRTDESFKLLIETQARTDERLNLFINVVERYISGNGGSSSPA